MALEVSIQKRLGSFLLDVSFSTEHEMLALLGASGCGKSMTLKCIAGIETPDRGRIVLNGRVLFDSEQNINLPPQKRRVGYLFQNYALFPNMTVFQNILAGAKGASRQEKFVSTQEHIRAFRLEGLENKRPTQLSGGEQQRTALARIFASEPELLLLDEPFSALDGYLKWQVELELADLLRPFDGDVVYVSHSRDEVYRLCSHVCVLSRGHSEPKEATKTLFAAPGSVDAALISGCKNISRIKKVDSHTVFCTDWGVTLNTAAEVGEDVTWVGVRAHYIRPAQPGDDNILPCRVRRVIDDVFSTVVMLSAADDASTLLRMELSKQEIPWEPIQVSIRPEDVMLLTGKR